MAAVGQCLKSRHRQPAAFDPSSESMSFRATVLHNFR